MTVMTPIEEAAWVYANVDGFDRQKRFDAAVSLGEWKVFSLRQIAALTGLSHTTVYKLTGSKKDRTGGKFSPECLPELINISARRKRGDEVKPAEVKAMLSAGSGTSPYFAAKLGGISESWLRRLSRE